MIDRNPNRSIASMALKYGLSLRILRFYEQEGILAPVRRGTLRLYDATDEIKLQLVLQGKRLGMSLREIKELILTSDARKEAEEGRLPSPIASLPVETVERKLIDLEARLDAVLLAIGELKQHAESCRTHNLALFEQQISRRRSVDDAM